MAIKSKPVLFTYRITHDKGVAPNPYWGVCTLVICKPVIRRTAEVGDWIVGIGSKEHKVVCNKIVFAMKVTQKMTLEEYDKFTARKCRRKISDLKSRNPKRWVGDSIFDYSTGSPKPRLSLHRTKPEVLAKDIRGENALLSRNFYYFGVNAISVPPSLRSIIPKDRGDRSKANEPYVEPFIKWIEGLGYEPNFLYGEPSNPISKKSLSSTSICSPKRAPVKRRCS